MTSTLTVPEGIDHRGQDAGQHHDQHFSGNDKQQVGQVAAEIRRWRKPEPYKGKGIKYDGRVHLPQRRQEEVMTMAKLSLFDRSAVSRVRTALKCPFGARIRVRACRCIARASHIYAQIIDDAAGPDPGLCLDAGQGCTCAKASGARPAKSSDAAADVGKRVRRCRHQGCGRHARSCSTVAASCFMAA